MATFSICLSNQKPFRKLTRITGQRQLPPMGSTISIVNNTPDHWVCKMGYDEVALKIGILIASIVGVIAATIATGGMASPLMTIATSAGTTALLGVSTAALGTVGNVVLGVAGGITIIGSVSKFSLSVATSIIDKLVNEDFHHIKPGEKHSWKRSLSLWQQGTCVQTSILDERTAKTRTLYMRPIFSGSTIDSNRDHDIQWWIDNHGTSDHLTVGNTSTAPKTRMLSNNSTSETVKYTSFLVHVSEADEIEQS